MGFSQFQKEKKKDEENEEKIRNDNRNRTCEHRIRQELWAIFFPLALRSLGASEAEMELALPLVLWFLLELAIAATAYDFPDLPL